MPLWEGERYHYGTSDGRYDFVLMHADPTPVWKLLRTSNIKARRNPGRADYSIMYGGKYVEGLYKTAKTACGAAYLFYREWSLGTKGRDSLLDRDPYALGHIRVEVPDA